VVVTIACEPIEQHGCVRRVVLHVLRELHVTLRGLVFDGNGVRVKAWNRIDGLCVDIELSLRAVSARIALPQRAAIDRGQNSSMRSGTPGAIICAPS